MAVAHAVAERRRYPRYERDDASLSVEPASGEAAAFPEEPWINDLSLGGLGLSARAEIKPGTEFSFRLDLPDGPVRGRGVVRWVLPQGLGWRCGVEMRLPGWLGRRRLRLFLEPDAPDPLRLLDQAGMVAVAAVVALVAADLLGIGLGDVWGGLRDLLGR